MQKSWQMDYVYIDSLPFYTVVLWIRDSSMPQLVHKVEQALMHLEPQQGSDTGTYHNVRITLLFVGTLIMSTTTDGLLGSMLCHAEPLQETLAII